MTTKRAHPMTKKPVKKNPHRGSSVDDLLKEQGMFEEFQAAAIKNVIAFQLTRAIEAEQTNERLCSSPRR
jgi:hypothetical protein